jgi:hypothetical protein
MSRNRKPVPVTPTIVTDMGALQQELEESAEALREAELTVVSAVAVRDESLTRYRNAGKAFQAGVSLISTSTAVAVVS